MPLPYWLRILNELAPLIAAAGTIVTVALTWAISRRSQRLAERLFAAEFSPDLIVDDIAVTTRTIGDADYGTLSIGKVQNAGRGVAYNMTIRLNEPDGEFWLEGVQSAKGHVMVPGEISLEPFDVCRWKWSDCPTADSRGPMACVIVQLCCFDMTGGQLRWTYQISARHGTGKIRDVVTLSSPDSRLARARSQLRILPSELGYAYPLPRRFEHPR